MGRKAKGDTIQIRLSKDAHARLKFVESLVYMLEGRSMSMSELVDYIAKEYIKSHGKTVIDLLNKALSENSDSLYYTQTDINKINESIGRILAVLP